MDEFAGLLGDRAAAHELTPVVRGLQSGIPFIEPAAERLSGEATGEEGIAFSRQGLKVDGVLGPKTHAAARRAVAKLGPQAVADVIDLGRFEDTLRGAKRTPAQLAAAADALFAKPRGAAGRKGAGAGGDLQRHLNHLGRVALDADWPDLVVDGQVGPRTAQVFNALDEHYGPATITQFLGEKLRII
jgi:hypothetical protein